MSERLKLKLQGRSILKGKLVGRSTLTGKVGVHFPANVVGNAPITVTQVNGDYVIGVDGDALVEGLELTASIEVIVDGGAAVITTGVKCDLEVPFDAVITKATLLADQSGDIVMDVWKDAYGNYPPTVADSITAAAKPTLSAAAKAQDSTLTGWDVAIAAGDTLRFNVDSVATVKRVTLSLECLRV